MEPNMQQLGGSVQETLFSLADLTVTASRSTEQIRAEIKTARQMIKENYEASESYQSQAGRADAEKKMLLDIKAEIDKQPAVDNLLAKVKELTRELKDKEQSISDYALEYSRLSGATEFDRDGETFEIVRTAKLVKKH